MSNVQSDIVERRHCRACHGELESIFDFGEFPIVNFGDKDELKSPLHLVKCKSCHLVQLKHTVNPDLLFRRYYYKSGVNQTMRNHLENIVEDAIKRQKMNEGDIVIDIGANDGTLLSKVSNKVVKIGFEPALNIQKVKGCGTIISDYFSAKAFEDAQDSLEKGSSELQSQSY